jgi:aldehyde dehydrogenase (NAD+)
VAKFARLLEDNKEDLAQILTREEGKTLAESRGELSRSINVAEFCAGEARRLNGETIQSELPANFAYTVKEPHGVVACITPWNFPVRFRSGKSRPRSLPETRSSSNPPKRRPRQPFASASFLKKPEFRKAF